MQRTVSTRSISASPDRPGSSTASPWPRDSDHLARASRSPSTAAPSSRSRSSTPTAPACTRCSPRVERAEPATTRPSSTASPTSRAVVDIDEIVYLRPSRYCESDTLGSDRGERVRRAEWSSTLLKAVDRLGQPTADLRRRLAACRPTAPCARCSARQGVCRDFAHLSVALLRALNVPARLAAVYAPGPQPDGVPCGRRGARRRQPGGSSTPPSSRRGRACCASPPAATRPTPRS